MITEGSWLYDYGQLIIWVAAVVVAIGVLWRVSWFAKIRHYIWAKLVSDPVSAWSKDMIGQVVEKKVSERNGGGSVADTLHTMQENQADMQTSITTMHDCLDRRATENSEAVQRLVGQVGYMVVSTNKLRERVRHLFWSLEIPIVELDAKGGLEYCNPAFTQLTGLTEDEASGEGWIMAIYEEDRGRVASAWSNAVDSGRTIELRYRWRNVLTGAVTAVRSTASPFTDDQGTILGWVASIEPVEQHLSVIMDTENHDHGGSTT